MPLSTTEKSTLQTSAQTLIDEINALVVDPDPNPLQVQLDAANATIASLNTQVTSLQSKIDAAKAAIAQADAADAQEDTARANALAALN